MKFPYLTARQILPDMQGFYLIDHNQYHAGIGISSSAVKRALQSYAVYTHPQTAESDALVFGRAFHAALLEPVLFARDYVVAPGISGNKNSNAYKAIYQTWENSVKDKIIVDPEDYVTIKNMIATVKAHPEYDKLPYFDAEVMAVTTDVDSGLLVKCKADLFGSAIIDFKSTSYGVRPSDMLNSIVNYGYHVSAAFYQDIIAAVTGERIPFIIVPVTKKAPFECEFYRLSDELLDEGRKLYKAGLRRIRKWNDMPAETRIKEEKTIRTLYPSSRVIYNSKDILDFIGQ